MAANHFFDDAGLGLDPHNVHFTGTRSEKIERIRALACTHFIDDLEEVFLEAAFPPTTARLLYEPGRRDPAPAGVRLVRTWQEIREYFFPN
jgi:hypothetical protein